MSGHDQVVSNEEIIFGDFTPGRYGWVLANVRQLNEPVMCSGAQQLWEVEPRIEARVREQLEVGE